MQARHELTADRGIAHVTGQSRIRGAMPSDTRSIGWLVGDGSEPESMLDIGHRWLSNADMAFMAEHRSAATGKWSTVGAIALYDTDELNRHVAVALAFDTGGTYVRCLGRALDQLFRYLLCERAIRTVTVTVGGERPIVKAGGRRWLEQIGSLPSPDGRDRVRVYQVRLDDVRRRLSIGDE